MAGIRPLPPLVLPNMPGYWKPTPPANASAAYTNYPDVRGFIVENGRHFLPEGRRRSPASATPPSSTRPSRGCREQHGPVGGADADLRSLGRRWHDHQLVRVSNGVVASLASSRGWSGLETARAFALHHGRARWPADDVHRQVPLRAVAAGDGDPRGRHRRKPGDRGGSNWLPLLTTPPLSQRPGQHGVRRRGVEPRPPAPGRAGRCVLRGDLDRRRLRTRR